MDFNHTLTAEELEAQKPVRLGRMRFAEDLEAAFRQDYSDQGSRGRVWILAVPMALFCFAAQWGAELYSTPRELQGIFTPINWVVTVLLAGALTCHLARIPRQYMEAVIIGIGAVIGIWMSLSGMMARQFQMEIPDGLGVLYLQGMLVVARVPFRRAVISMLITLMVMIGLQVWMGGAFGTLKLRYLEQALTLAIGTGAGYLLEFYSRNIWLQVKILECLSRTDPLTGISNRRGVHESMSLTLRHAVREHRPMTLMILDLDFFKGLNDHYGHEAGDVALRATAQFLITKTRRPLDVCGRLGGEEFVIALFDCDYIGAKARCQNLVTDLHSLGVENRASKVSQHLTVSVGAVSFWPSQGVQVAELLRAADDNLYRAKREGRNRFVLTQVPTEPKETPEAPEAPISDTAVSTTQKET